jgi:hypothetical protein
MAEITRAQLEDHLAALRAQRDQAIANANAAGGGIQVIEALVATLDAPEQPPKETKA